MAKSKVKGSARKIVSKKSGKRTPNKRSKKQSVKKSGKRSHRNYKVHGKVIMTPVKSYCRRSPGKGTTPKKSPIRCTTRTVPVNKTKRFYLKSKKRSGKKSPVKESVLDVVINPEVKPNSPNTSLALIAKPNDIFVPSNKLSVYSPRYMNMKVPRQPIRPLGLPFKSTEQIRPRVQIPAREEVPAREEIPVREQIPAREEIPAVNQEVNEKCGKLEQVKDFFADDDCRTKIFLNHVKKLAGSENDFQSLSNLSSCDKINKVFSIVPQYKRLIQSADVNEIKKLLTRVLAMSIHPDKYGNLTEEDKKLIDNLYRELNLVEPYRSQDTTNVKNLLNSCTAEPVPSSRIVYHHRSRRFRQPSANIASSSHYRASNLWN